MTVTSYQSYAGWYNSIVGVLPENPEMLPAVLEIIPLEENSQQLYQEVLDRYDIATVDMNSLGSQDLNIVALTDDDGTLHFKKQDKPFPMDAFYRDLWSECGEHQFTLTLKPIAAE